MSKSFTIDQDVRKAFPGKKMFFDSLEIDYQNIVNEMEALTNSAQGFSENDILFYVSYLYIVLAHTVLTVWYLYKLYRLGK